MKNKITDSEYELMKILWEAEEPLAVSEVGAQLQGNDWTPSTVSTFLQRLLKKGVVACEKRGKANLYYPVIERSVYDISETESFLSKVYHGSVKNMVAALYENEKLTKNDLADLRKLFDLE